MRNKIDSVFQKLKKNKRKALIFYVTAGYPKLSNQGKIISALEKNGADLIEIGVPFSDPIADGPTIQFSSQVSLKNKTSLKQILKWTKPLSKKTQTPLVIMSYMNPILKFGIKNFARVASASGISGVIIPDLIPEEGSEFKQVFAKHGLHLIFLVSPTTPIARQKSIASKTGGFLYAVSVTGVTGARKKISAETKNWLKKLGKMTKKPVCVGFGISKPAHIQHLRQNVDGFIVGSALINIIRKSSGSTVKSKIQSFARSLSKECANGR